MVSTIGLWKWRLFKLEKHEKELDVSHCFSGPLGFFRLVFRLRIKNEPKFSGRFRIVGLRCFRSPLASILEPRPLALVDGSADELVVVLVDDVDLPDRADQRTRGDESGMGEVSANCLQGKKSRIFSENKVKSSLCQSSWRVLKTEVRLTFSSLFDATLLLLFW